MNEFLGFAPPRVWTLAEIEARVALLDRIATDIMVKWQHVLRTRAELERSESDARRALRGSRDALAHRERVAEITEELNRAVDRLNDYIAEIEALGGTVQEYRRGIVTFTIERDGRTVLASWRPGEPHVRYWHELHEGFADRRRLECSHLA